MKYRIILVLAFALAGCSQAKFMGSGETDSLSSSSQEQESEPAPRPVPQVKPQPLPQPAPSGSYSYCPELPITRACPDNSADCTCTDTMPAGTFNSLEQKRGKFFMVPNGSKGPDCKIGSGTANVHSGTVIGPKYGVCTRYCTVRAYCVNGNWVNFDTTW